MGRSNGTLFELCTVKLCKPLEDGTGTVYLMGELPVEHPRHWDFIHRDLKVKWARLGERNLMLVHSARFESDSTGRHFLVLQIKEEITDADLRLELQSAVCLSGQMLTKGVPGMSAGTPDNGFGNSQNQPSGGV